MQELENVNKVLSAEKGEEVRSQLVSHFGLTEQELAIYPLSDLIQMGVGMKNV